VVSPVKFFIFLFLVCLTLPVFGQSGKIRGTITDSRTGERLTGALVRIANSEKAAVSNLEGQYEIEGLALGQYTLSATYIGYNPTRPTKVEITNEAEVVELVLIMQESMTTLTEVEVIGKMDMESEVSASRIEQKADNIINVISARSIELSPDLSVADVSQRVSGVSIERSVNGDGRFVIIRGMEPRYNNTLINGVKIPSPDPRNRFIPLDIFPAEMLLRMEVTKALTPDMEGDAIGGTLNMVLRPAPDTLIASANIATGYNQFFLGKPFLRWDRANAATDPASSFPGQIPPSGSFNYKNMDFQSQNAPINGLLGGTVGQRFFKNKIGVLVSGSYQNTFRGTESEIYRVSVDPSSNNTVYTGVQTRSYYSQLVRSGLNGVVDYRIDKRNKITLTNIYMDMREVQTRTISDTSFVSNRSGPGTGRIDLFERSRYQTQVIRSHNLQGEHKLASNLLLDWSAVYCSAFQDIPDQSEYNRSYVISEAPGTEDSARFDNVVKEWQKNNDKDYAAYFNVTYKLRAMGQMIELKGGGLYRDKTRENRFNNYKLLHKGVSPYSSDINDINPANLDVIYNPNNAFFNNENFDASENVTAYYAQVRFLVRGVQVLTGFRTEMTTQSFQTKARRTFNAPTEASLKYTDFLPSIHLKYMIDGRQNLRLSAFKSISRPSYFELVPYRLIGEAFDEVGNFNLKRTEADNFDLRYEFFPNYREQFAVGLFYKNIKNPVEYGFTDASGSTLAPQNYGTATNFGIEIVAVKYFGDFGISTNYTYTNSSLTMLKIRNRDTITTLVEEVRPLQGQSAHIANASLLYRSDKYGLNCQLSYVLTGRRIVQISQLEGKDFYQRNLSLLDFSVDKVVRKNLVIFGKFTNLLNSPYEEEVKDGTLVRRDFFAQNYIIGLRIKW
jgi:TonB-dependent receptor